MRNKCEPEGVNQCYLRFRLAGVFAKLVLPLRNTSIDDPSNRHFPREACTWSYVFVCSPAEEIPAGGVGSFPWSQTGKGRCTWRCTVQDPARLGRGQGTPGAHAVVYDGSEDERSQGAAYYLGRHAAGRY